MTYDDNPLAEAARILRATGWCRRWATDDEGRHCLLGAINKAVGVTSLLHRALALTVLAEALTVLAEVLLEQYYPVTTSAEHHGDHPRRVAYFNDLIIEDEAAAIAVLEKAAVRWEEKGEGR